ncbi:MAG: DUF1465 family protein [Caulobacteraceae bacterium]|nr:DUF1465 family protein [Caulobacteraceae bacterium]
MNRLEGSAHKFARGEKICAAVPFACRLAASPAFQELFREGMTLVEQAAAYLDGPGRAESRGLSRPASLAYATESMRITSRLMQVASWLLVQRAVNEGSLTPGEGLRERKRARLSREPLGCAPEALEQLPATFRALSERSLRLQERVIHLDAGLASARSGETGPRSYPVVQERERLRAAFG